MYGNNFGPFTVSTMPVETRGAAMALGPSPASLLIPPKPTVPPHIDLRRFLWARQADVVSTINANICGYLDGDIGKLAIGFSFTFMPFLTFSFFL